MHLFYNPNINSSDLKAGKQLDLPQEEALHAIRVLRLKIHDKVYVTDGLGSWISCHLVEIGKRNAVLEVDAVEHHYAKRNYQIHMAVAPTKNIKRFDWFLEKATEMGIDEVTPIISFHSERRDINIERSNKVITAAMKQSLKAYHPKLNEAVKLKDFIKRAEADQKFVAHYEGPQQEFLKNKIQVKKKILVLIGPEGDFSEDEMEEIKSHGFESVSLGNTRLRTETAALTACFSINLMNQ